MSRPFTLAASALLLGSFAQAQQSTIGFFQILNGDASSSGGYGLHFQALIPASFPRPAKQVSIKMECRDKADVSSFDVGTFQAVERATITESTLAFGQFKATCIAGKLNVQHPNLFTWLTPKLSDICDLGDSTQYGQDAKGFAIWKDRMTFSLAMGSTKWVTFNRAGNALRVIRTSGNIAVSVSQGKAPMPLRLEDKDYAPFRINSQQPFSLHLTEDGNT